MIVCEVVEEKTEMKTYGFRFYDGDSGETICTVSDIFTEADKAESFKSLINESDIEAIHIHDIIEDMTAS